MTSPLIHEAAGLQLEDILHFDSNGFFSIAGRRGRVVKIEEKRISLNEIERRLLELEGICEAAALPVTRGGRQGIGVLLVLDEKARQRWHQQGKKRRNWPGAAPCGPGLSRSPSPATGALSMRCR